MSSNGEAERLVGVFKTVMQRSVGEEGKERDKVTMGFLRTPNCATGRTPAELMIGRQVRTPLSLFYNHPYIMTSGRRYTPPRSRSWTTSSFGATVLIGK